MAAQTTQPDPAQALANVGQQVDQQRKVVERAEGRIRALEDKLEQARKAHEVAKARLEDLSQ